MDRENDILKFKEKSEVQFNGENKYSLNWTKPYMAVAEKEFDERFQKLKNDYDKLVDEIKLNDLIYNSEIKFVPVIGNIYHLYKKDNIFFLSMISPSEWKMNYIISVKFGFNGKWEKIE